ncbi:hypothetical protein ACU4HD_23815 [Cupriavidus basilensis]
MSKVILFHATGIKDEEDFTGFVVRQAELSNVDNHRGVMALLDRTGYRPAFVHPANVEAIGELFPGAASNLKCNTLLRVRCSDAKQNFVPTTSA